MSGASGVSRMSEANETNETREANETNETREANEIHGWFCPALQQLRLSYPSRHKFNGKILTSPPYIYWTLHTDADADAKSLALVTEVTDSCVPTPRQIANGDIYVGRLDKYWGRAYTKL
jgi:hypothetical protein